MMTRAHGHSKGLSLVEVLIASGLIIILVLLVAPMMKNMKGASASAACLHNMRGIGVGILTYASDNNGKLFTHRPASDGNQTWVQYTLPYLDDNKKTLRCPGDPSRPDEIEFTYKFNATGSEGGFDIERSMFGKPLSAIVKPSKTIMLLDIAYKGEGTILIKDQHSELWWDALNTDSLVSPIGPYFRPHSHFKQNILFADGHAETVEVPIPFELWSYKY